MFFAFNHPKFDCRLTLFDFPSFGIESPPAKYYSCFTYSSKKFTWDLSHSGDISSSPIDFHHSPIGNLPINSYPLYIYCLKRDIASKTSVSSLHTELPAWRSTLSFNSLSQSYGSFQSEIVLFPNKGSCFSCIPRLTTAVKREIWLIHASLETCSRAEQATVTAFDASGVINEEITLPTYDNCATKLDIPAHMFGYDLMLRISDKSSIPILIDSSETAISVEHTHPLPSFFPPSQRFGISTSIKKLWSPA